MKMKLIYLGLMMTTTFAFSGEQPCADGGTNIGGAAVGALAGVAQMIPSGGCPNVSKLRGICNDVYSRTPDRTNPNFYAYSYEKKIYDAACVDFNKDSPLQARQKLQILWNNHQDLFRCDANNFRVSQGSILKYAVEMRNYGILDNAATAWKLNLNHIDKSDNKTILDFVQDKMNRAADPESKKVLQNYYDILKKNGAKMRSEIST